MTIMREGAMPRNYVSANLTPEAVAALRRATLTASLAVGRRVTQSAVIVAALAVAELHPDELAAVLAPQPAGGEA
jgi:hypothetical protein